MTIDFAVIDEAHCITQWGHDFRPAYLALRDAIKAIGQPPILALTVLNTLREAHLVQISGCVAEIFETKGKADKEKLKSMVVFAQTALCRWNSILKYFGEPALPNGCQNCDGCERLKSHPISLQ